MERTLHRHRTKRGEQVNGSRAVVFGARGDEVGHFSNVVNQGGTIRFLDGQTGKPTNLSDGYTQWFILRTDR
ncbi:toxin glutamine deamidase domain-containing protein [Burkholderia stagnalis]|uniref:toxin glutamine deamidase domain-containing protein n=1 Tax=Burkholderia stagnalis TaxID=1503054 RepID=UPI000F9DE21E|nr:hypothetical protein DF110_34845 [Burkholderia stagnalis]